jgi:hypothetical protein
LKNLCIFGKKTLRPSQRGELVNGEEPKKKHDTSPRKAPKAPPDHFHEMVLDAVWYFAIMFIIAIIIEIYNFFVD